MRPFDTEALRAEPCPKCRGNEYASEYANFRTAYRWILTWTEDRLEVSCSVCGYSFDMAAADAPTGDGLMP